MFHKCIFLKLQSVYQNNNLSPYRYVVKATAVMLKRVEICTSILRKIFRLGSVKHMFETLYVPFIWGLQLPLPCAQLIIDKKLS